MNVSKRSDPRVLLVDDKPSNLLALECLLEEIPIVCLKATSGNEALQIASEQTLALILLDVQMPGMDGYETATILRNSMDTHHIPIIFVTGQNKKPGQVFQAYETGAVDYLHKPVDPVVLMSKVRVFIELYQKNLELIQANQELRRAQRLMVDILDLAEDAVLSINSENQISFINQCAEQLLGCSAENTIGHSISKLFPVEDLPSHDDVLATNHKSIQLTVHQKNPKSRVLAASMVAISSGNELHRVLVLDDAENCDAAPISVLPGKERFAEPMSRMKLQAPIAELRDDLKLEQRRVRALGDAFEVAVQFLTTGGKELVQELRHIDQVIDGINEYVHEVPADEILELLVRTMSQSVVYWETMTGKTKIELAEESGIWKAYLDKSTYRTKTLDRYLRVETLPKKPRWKEVFATARFVLTHCPPPSTEPEQSAYSSLKFINLKLEKLHNESHQPSKEI